MALFLNTMLALFLLCNGFFVHGDSWINPSPTLPDLAISYTVDQSVLLTWDATGSGVNRVTLYLRHWSGLNSDVRLATLLQSAPNTGTYKWNIGQSDNINGFAIASDDTFCFDLIDPSGSIHDRFGWTNNTLSSKGFRLQNRPSSTSSIASSTSTSSSSTTQSNSVITASASASATPSEQPAKAGDTLGTSIKIGIGLGLGLGLPLLACLLIGGTIVVLRRRQKSSKTKSSDLYAMEKENFYCDSGSPPQGVAKGDPLELHGVEYKPPTHYEMP